MRNFQIFIAALILLLIACESNETADNKGIEASEPVTLINQTGKQLFDANCRSCHQPDKPATGPALKGVIHRAPGKEWIYQFVHNPAKLISEGDKYANEVYTNFGKTAMTSFPNLSNADIDSIMVYCGGYE